MATSNADLNWIANYIWGIADDVLRDLYVRGKYRDVILPMTVLRRLDAVLEDSKQEVLNTKALLDDTGVVTQDAALRQAAGQAFYNTSKFTLRDLRARASRQQLTADFHAYLDGFSPNVQDMEYEPDTDLRDTEQIPLQEEGGIEAFLRREVLPYAADAWNQADSVKIGYEISFTRYFYKPKPMRSLREIRADILALERETEGLLAEILGHGEPAST